MLRAFSRLLVLKNLGEYSNLYLRMDCLLLANVFQNFRKWTLETYEIEALHFVSLPSLSMSCALKQSRVKLQLIDDPDTYLMTEQGIRGYCDPGCPGPRQSRRSTRWPPS